MLSVSLNKTFPSFLPELTYKFCFSRQCRVRRCPDDGGGHDEGVCVRHHVDHGSGLGTQDVQHGALSPAQQAARQDGQVAQLQPVVNSEYLAFVIFYHDNIFNV